MEPCTTAVEGVRVGHASDLHACTGCTVILCERGAVGGVDVRGWASGTREIDALAPHHLVDKVHGLLLAGGSAFGLEAAAGVMRYLEERGIGFDVGVTKVPIVPSAILFDLKIGDFRTRPDAAMGYRACAAAVEEGADEGSVGVGTGATVGKLFGVRHAMKGGVGMASVELPGGLRVWALAAVNAFGDVRDPSTGDIVAGARDPASGRLANTVLQMKQGRLRRSFHGESTTLAVIATNGRLTKGEAILVARMGQGGLARTISPVHTAFDGDVIFALATGQVEGDVNLVGQVGAEMVAAAILRAIMTATSLGGVPAYRELHP
ncbi:MAG: P1 family peptidase [candidate division NC10 bacterium]|nr:P1 family peptidase [candidate division NC10 bacterium]MCH7897193.1 P1 family peptidase [candidate division NC10 bacterium]MCZ6551392.1 P1 family peptidase [candidate division NC10 bacterium]